MRSLAIGVLLVTLSAACTGQTLAVPEEANSTEEDVSVLSNSRVNLPGAPANTAGSLVIEPSVTTTSPPPTTAPAPYVAPENAPEIELDDVVPIDTDRKQDIAELPPPSTAPPGPSLPALDLRAPASPPMRRTATLDAPDPFVVRSGSSWLAFSTNNSGGNVPIWISDDATETWRLSHDALPTLPSWASGGHTWAPAVGSFEGGWKLYFTARERGTTRQCIGVATAASVGGPYNPAAGGPLVCQRDLGGSIDPSVFTDEGGAKYLLWKSDGNCCGIQVHLFSARLAADGLGLASEPTIILSASRSWEGGIIEGPTMVRRSGRLHLFYSANWYASSSYSIAHAVCHGPLGPCERSRDGVWRSTSGALKGPGGPEAFIGPDGAVWLAHHAWYGGVGYRSGGLRPLVISRLSFQDWTPPPTTTTTVPPPPLPACPTTTVPPPPSSSTTVAVSVPDTVPPATSAPDSAGTETTAETDADATSTSTGDEEQAAASSTTLEPCDPTITPSTTPASSTSTAPPTSVAPTTSTPTSSSVTSDTVVASTVAPTTAGSSTSQPTTALTTTQPVTSSTVAGASGAASTTAAPAAA